MHLAARSGSKPIVHTLLEKGLDPNIKGAKGHTPLHLAAQCDRPDITGLLLKGGAQVIVKALTVAISSVDFQYINAKLCVIAIGKCSRPGWSDPSAYSQHAGSHRHSDPTSS